jgi:hypothetical protein
MIENYHSGLVAAVHELPELAGVSACWDSNSRPKFKRANESGTPSGKSTVNASELERSRKARVLRFLDSPAKGAPLGWRMSGH